MELTGIQKIKAKRELEELDTLQKGKKKLLMEPKRASVSFQFNEAFLEIQLMKISKEILF